MNSQRLLLLSCATTALVGGVGGVAHAQESSGGIEEIVITAEKREASIQDVPVAVSAYTAATRDRLGVSTVDDLARLTPSLSYTNNDRLTLRGVGRRTNAIGTDPSVALYSDGVFSNSMADASTPSLFIARTEVLRGPQGTLYGRNSIGGALNVISRRPSDEFEGEIRATVGTYQSRSLYGRVSGPLSDSFRYAIGAGLDQRGEGFIENIGSGRDTGEVERVFYDAQFEADITDNLTARVTLRSVNWDDTMGNGNTLTGVISRYDTTSIVNPEVPLYYNPTFGFAGVNPSVNDPFTVSSNRSAVGELSEHFRVNADVTWDLSAVTVRYLGGYQEYSYFTNPLGGDTDGTNQTTPRDIVVPIGTPTGLPAPLNLVPGTYTATGASTNFVPFYTEAQTWYSNEINISSNGSGPVQWIAGIYQYHQDYEQPTGGQVLNDPRVVTPYDTRSLLTLGTTGLQFSAANPNADFVEYGGALEVDSYAAFGQVDWDLTPTLTATVGLRYTYDEKVGYDLYRVVARNTATTTLATLLSGGFIPLSTAQNLAFDITTLAVCGSLSYDDLTAVLPANLDPLGGGCSPALGVTQNPNGGLRRNLSGDWDATTGTVGLQWEPTDDLNFYARYSRGYKSGGWLAGSGLIANPYADAESVDAYEIGAKTRFGSTLQLNTSVFFNQYEGYQQPNAVLNNVGSTTTQFLNLDGEAFGVELEALWAPVESLEFMLNYAYLNTEITGAPFLLDNTDPTGVAPGARRATNVGANWNQNVIGNALPQTPEHKVTFGTTYTYSFDSGATLSAVGLYTYTDSMQATIFNNPIYTSPAWENVDFRLIFNDADNAFTVIGFVKNALDEVGYQSSTGGTPTAVGSRRTVLLNYPRTAGVELQFRF